MVKAVPPAHSFSYEGAQVQVYHANVGEGLPRHEHEYNHATFCTAGKCVVRHEKGEVFVDKHTQPINLIAPHWHEIEAVEDGTVFINVFAIGANHEN